MRETQKQLLFSAGDTIVFEKGMTSANATGRNNLIVRPLAPNQIYEVIAESFSVILRRTALHAVFGRRRILSESNMRLTLRVLMNGRTSFGRS
jgi:hypothetical protein